MFNWMGRVRGVVAALVPLALLTACGGPAPDDAPGGAPPGLDLVASFYPLEFVAQRVAGDVTAVRSLTKPGLEPHDVELTPRQIGSVSDADLIVYLPGFQPAVDDALVTVGSDAGFDVSAPARLVPHPTVRHAEDEHSEDEHAEDEHTGDTGHTDDHASEDGAPDPHFWLDPIRLADVADAIADRLAALAPDHAATFAANSAALRRQLTDLDSAFTTGLRDCRQRHLVTGHGAFGYLAARYGFEQVGISGLDPEAEPSPRALAHVAAFVERHDIATVYSETLVSPAVARTVAAETGARVAVLDPVEGITDASAGRDYLEVMRANLATLREGQQCS